MKPSTRILLLLAALFFSAVPAVVGQGTASATMQVTAQVVSSADLSVAFEADHLLFEAGGTSAVVIGLRPVEGGAELLAHLGTRSRQADLTRALAPGQRVMVATVDYH